MRVRELPIVVCGERKEPGGGNDIVVPYGKDLEVRIPALDRADVQKMRDCTNADLRALHIDDIAIFMNEVGSLWLDEKSELRRLAIEYAADTTQYLGPSIYYDLGLLSTALRRIKIYDLLESEIGDPYYLDEWRPKKTVYLHAEPRGKVLHLMVGNIPMAGLFSIVRSILTKNVTIAKLPKRDIVTSLLFALSFIEVDPAHPITKSITAAYWEPGSPIEDEMLGAADVVCAWGQKESIEPIKRKLSYGTEFVEFGPKRSFHLIGRDTPDFDYAAMRAAYDISIYDQAACFSPLETFIEGAPGPYVTALGRWLEKSLTRIPKGESSVDEQANCTRSRADAKFRGWEVHHVGHQGWTIIVTDGPCAIEDHPLNRTMYVHPVKDLREALPFITKDTQTVAIHPIERAMAMADELAARGAARITEVGRVGRPRPGFAHDGMYPMARLVRWVTVERGIRFKYKFWGLSPDEDDRLFYGLGQAPEGEDPMFVWRAYEEVNLAGRRLSNGSRP
jgi:long-chain-fatty-acyl-CoA reductase